MNHTSTCPTCRIVQKVGFLSLYKSAAWKRSALLVLSVLMIAGTFVVAVLAPASMRESWLLWLLLAVISGLALLGVVVALRGCPNCVGRIFGGI